MTVIGAMITLFNLPALFRDVRRIGVFVCAGCLALALSAFAAAPLLEQNACLKFNLTFSRVESFAITIFSMKPSA